MTPRNALSRGHELLLTTATTASSARFAHTHTTYSYPLRLGHTTHGGGAETSCARGLDPDRVVLVLDRAAASLQAPTLA
jgi:hypothetical protein